MIDTVLEFGDFTCQSVHLPRVPTRPTRSIVSRSFVSRRNQYGVRTDKSAEISELFGALDVEGRGQ